MSDIRLLVVDDNPSIHIDFKKILAPEDEGNQTLEKAQAGFLGKPLQKKEFNFLIDSAYQGEDALHFVRKGIENQKRYAVAFIDVRMPPGMDGVETAQHLWELDPGIQIVICTAYSDYSWEELTKRLGQTDRFLILKKPFENIEVLQLANALAKKWYVSQRLREYLENLENVVEQRSAKLAKSLSLVRATLESTTDGILVMNTDQRVVSFNQKLLRMLRIPKTLLDMRDDLLAKKNVLDRLENPQEIITDLQEAYDYPERELHGFLVFKDKRTVEYFSIPERVENKIIGRVFCFRDITEHKKMEQQLIQQATHDILTGLPNRVLLYDRIQQALSFAKRNDQMVAILFLDLDYFKRINDSIGHGFGDKVLQIIATRLKESIRENDTIARIGGDEFVIVMPFLERTDAIALMSQKLLSKVAIPFTIKNKTLSTTASIGISFYPKDGQDVEALIRNADAANHAAKESGGGNFNFYTEELNINAMRRMTLEANLRQALEKKEFLLHYQPLVNLANGKIIGIEALLRWQHPKLGLIPPQEFIPMAEEIGLMLPIGDWVINTACTQNKAWQEQGLPPISVAVNLTGKQLAQSNIVEKVAEILKKTKLNPAHLELELTESALIESTDRIIRTLQELKNLGVKIAIDDFGTGYSSLSYLNRLPVDKIKIDRSFISYISQNPNDTAVVLAIIAVAKSLKITVLAEGVETKEELEFLRKSHCDEIQGYYIYRPESSEVITKILRKNPILK